MENTNKNTNNSSQDETLFQVEPDIDELLNTTEELSSEETITTELDNKKFVDMIYGMKDQLDQMLRMLEGKQIHTNTSINRDSSQESIHGEKIIEGVFDGEKMIGSDGKEYTIPPNYASKSKLVEGDIMKLTITANGSYVYKQIKTIERDRLVAELVSEDDTGHWIGLANGKTYKLLTASITFYKGKPGDTVILLVPEGGQSTWAAVETIN
jgi:hypothetical protein